MTRLETTSPAGPAAAAREQAGRRRGRCLAPWVPLMPLALMTGLPMASQAQDEVPFITTPDPVTLAMLQLAGVTAKDFVIDLGSGDGRIVITVFSNSGMSLKRWSGDAVRWSS